MLAGCIFGIVGAAVFPRSYVAANYTGFTVCNSVLLLWAAVAMRSKGSSRWSVFSAFRYVGLILVVFYHVSMQQQLACAWWPWLTGHIGTWGGIIYSAFITTLEIGSVMVLRKLLETFGQSQAYGCALASVVVTNAPCYCENSRILGLVYSAIALSEETNG